MSEVITIPEEKNFFEFRFHGSKTRRQGSLIPVSTSTAADTDKKENQKESPNGNGYGYHTNKTSRFGARFSYSGIKENERKLRCVICGKKSDFTLLHRNPRPPLSITVKEKYCQACADKWIIKL